MSDEANRHRSRSEVSRSAAAPDRSRDLGRTFEAGRLGGKPRGVLDGRSVPVDLRSLCDRAIVLLSALAADRDVDIEVVYFAHEAWVDADALWWVVFSLLDGEVRTAPVGSTLTLLTTPRSDATEIRITVWEDAGPGESGTRPSASARACVERDRARRLAELAPMMRGNRIVSESSADGSTLCLRMPRESATETNGEWVTGG